MNKYWQLHYDYLEIKPWTLNPSYLRAEDAHCFPAHARDVKILDSSIHHEKQTSSVISFTGNDQAKLMVIHEKGDEASDTLLTAMLKAIHFDRDAVYIANISPTSNTIAKSIAAEITRIKPHVILTFGAAVYYVLNTEAPLDQLRTHVHDYNAFLDEDCNNNAIAVIATYDPTHLLANPQDKRQAYADLKLAHQTYHAASQKN